MTITNTIEFRVRGRHTGNGRIEQRHCHGSDRNWPALYSCGTGRRDETSLCADGFVTGIHIDSAAAVSSSHARRTWRSSVRMLPTARRST